MFKKLFSIFTKTDVNTDIQKISEDFVDNMKLSLDKMKDDYFNPENYPLYQQEYYKLSQEIPNYSKKEELDIFYKKVNEVFDNMKKLYDTTDLEEKEKSFLYYDDAKTLNFCFIDSYYKLLREIGKKYKKIKDSDKAFEIFQQIVGGAMQDIKNMPDLFYTMRVTDVRFLIKEYGKRGDTDMQKSMEALEKEMVKKSKEEQLDEIHEELKWSIKNEKEKYDNFKSMLFEGVIGWKKSVTQHDDGVCGKCRKNAEVGRIPANQKFPSGHMYPPFDREINLENDILPCRCNVIYSLSNPNTGNLFDK